MTTVDVRRSPTINDDGDDGALVVRARDKGKSRRAWVARLSSDGERWDRHFVSSDSGLLTAASADNDRAFPITVDGVYEIEAQRGKRVYLYVSDGAGNLITYEVAAQELAASVGRDLEEERWRTEGNAAELRGTQLQRTWARKIRVGFLARAPLLLRQLADLYVYERADGVRLVAELIIAMRAIDDARWWIERRHHLIRDLSVEAGKTAGVAFPPAKGPRT